MGKWKSSKRNYDVYYGEYKNDKKSGKGQYTWNNGCIFDGYFLNDLKYLFYNLGMVKVALNIQMDVKLEVIGRQVNLYKSIRILHKVRFRLTETSHCKNHKSTTKCKCSKSQPNNFVILKI